MTTLHALDTNTTLRCYKNVMTTNNLPIPYTLLDYNGDDITDYNGDTQESYLINTDLIVLHAPETNMTLHAEK